MHTDSLLPSVTTIIIIGLGMVQAAPIENNQLLDWSNKHKNALVGSHQDILGTIHKDSGISPIQTLLCLKRRCAELSREPISNRDCTWQKCQSLLKTSQMASLPVQSTMKSHPQDSTVASLKHGDNPHDLTDAIEIGMRTSLKQQSLKRRKRWTYIDPLQVCIAQKCQGLIKVHFYQCVYKKCVGPQ